MRLKQIQRTVQIDFFSHLELVLWLGQVVEQELQDDGAAEATALYLEVGESGGRIEVLNVLDADEGGTTHGIREPISPIGMRRHADVVRTIFSKALSADVLIAVLAVVTFHPAAFVAQELHFPLL